MSKIPADDDGSEQGSIMLLIIALGIVLLLLATVIIGITSVYIQKKQLQNLADQMSTAAAQRVSGLGTDTDKPYVKLSNSSVQATVADTLQRSGASREFEGLSISEPTGAIDENTAQVTLEAQAEIPIVSILLPQGVQISASSSARSELIQ